MRVPPFRYMAWTKRHAGAYRYEFAYSGIPAATLPAIEDPARQRNSPLGDGDPAIEALLADRYGVPADHVLFVPGSTLANYVLLSCLIERGDGVLVESPAYENLPGLVRLLGGRLVELPRRAEDQYAVDPEALSAALGSGIRVVFFTNLHNPTGVRIPFETIEEIRTIAARHGARILIDEVYMDFAPDAPSTAYRPDDPTVVVTSSLTKVYGMGNLRTGYVLAPPELRETAARLLDYLTVLPPSASAAAAQHVLENLEEYRPRSLRLAEESQNRIAAWAARRVDVRYAEPGGGLIVFPRFEGIDDTGPLCDWLREERDTLLVPGRFFGDPGRVRMAALGETAVVEEGFSRIDEALELHRHA